jgi:hypothetical protein
MNKDILAYEKQILGQCGGRNAKGINDVLVNQNDNAIKYLKPNRDQVKRMKEHG